MHTPMKRSAVISRLVGIFAATFLVCLIAYQGATTGQWNTTWLIVGSLTVAGFSYELVTRGRRPERRLGPWGRGSHFGAF